MKNLFVVESVLTESGKVYSVVELPADYEISCEADAERCLSNPVETREEAIALADALQRRTSDMERIYKDERGCVYTASELEMSYAELKADGETEAETFADYLYNCTDGNGTLKEVTQ